MFNRCVGCLLLIQLAFVGYSQQQFGAQPSSPCPQIFEYRYDGNDWFGVITTNAPRLNQQEVVLQLSLSLRGSTTVGIENDEKHLMNTDNLIRYYY